MLNKVMLIGNLGADPEVRYFENGGVVANLRIATNESYKNKNGERVTHTEWHSVELWEGLAKVAEQYLKQGSLIYVEGKIKTETWTDPEGNNRKTVRIRGNSMTMLGSKSGGENSNQSAPQGEGKATPLVNEPSGSNDDFGSEVDDLPF